MKKSVINICLAAAAAFTLAGCNSLDQEPSNKFTEDRFWQSEERAQMVLNMAYNQMYENGKMWMDEYLSDNVIGKLDRNPAERQIRSGSANAGMNIFKDEWKWAYQGIKTTNVFMGKVHLVPGLPQAKRQSMEAQIRFIRAYLYFRLSNFYGAVPFFLRDIELEESKTMGRTPRAQIIAELHRELEEIIPQLPKTVATADRGMIRQGAAAMLNARMYLYDGKMDKVAEICKDIIDGVYGKYELFNPTKVTYSAYEDLFTSANEYNNEVILDYSQMPIIREWGIGDKVPRSTIGSGGAYFYPTELLAKEYINLDGTPFSYSQVTGGNSCYANRDPRMAATIVCDGATWRDIDLKTGSPTSTVISIDSNDENNVNRLNAGNATESGYYLRKWFDPAHRADMKLSTNIIMMRYADVLLMYAEAMNELDQMSSDVWDLTIKPIRERAGFTASGALDFPADKTKTELQEIIRRERHCELAFEGLRYYDVIRWGDGYKAFNQTLTTAKFKGNTSTKNIFQYTFNSAKDVLWPVPQSEIDNYPSLKPQNNGY